MRKTVLITGASSGIGAACAELAAARGYDVGIGYSGNLAGAEAVAAKVRAAGGKALLLRGDVSDPGDVERIFAECDAGLGPLSALVNNAGFGGPAARITEISYDRLRRVVDVNLIGSFLCAQAAVRRMSTREGGKGGVIINMGSMAAKIGAPNLFVDYAASKGAIDTFTRGLGDEEAPYGIRVMAVRPGLIETEFHAKIGDPDRVERLHQGVPMRRGGSAMEVAETVLWLMSDQASYLTSTTVDVSGGR